MPRPRKNEKKQAFIKRCIPYVLKDKSAKGVKQAMAMCYSIWRNKNK